MFIRPTLLAGVLAACLAPVSAAPARAADAQDIAKILGGIATVYIIGRAVSAARADDRDDARDKHIRRHEVRPDRYGDRVGRDFRHRHDQAFVRHGDRRVVLPAACRSDFIVRQGDGQRILGARCLSRYGVNLARLPRACQLSVHVGGRARTGYAEGCLRHRGFRLY